MAGLLFDFGMVSAYCLPIVVKYEQNSLVLSNLKHSQLDIMAHNSFANSSLHSHISNDEHWSYRRITTVMFQCSPIHYYNIFF